MALEAGFGNPGTSCVLEKIVSYISIALHFLLLSLYSTPIFLFHILITLPFLQRLPSGPTVHAKSRGHSEGPVSQQISHYITLSHLLLYATISSGECWHVIFLGSVLPSMAQKHWSIFTMAGVGLGVGDPLFRK